jgi:hypothetical protein
MNYQIEIGDYKSAHDVLDIHTNKTQLKNASTEACDYENNMIFLARQ